MIVDLSMPPPNPDPPFAIQYDPSHKKASKKYCIYVAIFGMLMIGTITSVIIVTPRKPSHLEPISISPIQPTINSLPLSNISPSFLPTIYPLSTPSTIPSN